MSLTKRGSIWWIIFTSPSGDRIRCSSGTTEKAKAQELHDQMKAEAWRVIRLGEKPSYTWDEAGVKFLLETQHKASHRDDKAKLGWLQQFLRNKPLQEIDRELIAKIAQRKVAEASTSTANRYLALIRTILRKACHEWEWIDKVPKIRAYPEPKRRIRWLPPEQVAVLMKELPEHLRDVVVFSLSTGLRQGNVLKLEWSQVDLDLKLAWIHADQAKARKAISVPLNSTAMGALLRQAGKHPVRVFTYCGKPLVTANSRAWRKALERSGITDFRWHDLRHTWASWLAQSGVPMNVLQELGGWASYEMVRKYAHLSPAQLGVHAEKVSERFSDTILAQSTK
ncbi:Tyrosine recombinase XerC [Ferriphaselus amnicola]|uniref:Tyrosine recombinase XerC n=1 Tax=Ferriphaselus amnicola TaxID=1188319 RepID=A0A2Z6G8M1_9PROT|nr:site-specific integrase [Ferriphaselus amnicola]BBE49733.1 Tyrosine recombinase XerC [Ferriphaselus amnicola]